MNKELIEHIESLPQISLSLPFVFNGTAAKIEDVSIKCARCGAEIHSKDIKGYFVAVGQSATLLAYALCYADRTITPVEARFATTGELLTRGPAGWVQGRWINKKPIGWFSKLLNCLNGK